jgi:ferredoxin
MPAAIQSVGEFVRRVVDSLLRGECRGRFLCARCLVKLTRDHLDRSYTTRDVARAMDDVFRAPGRITHALTSTCVACASRTMPCLGVPSL